MFSVRDLSGPLAAGRFVGFLSITLGFFYFTVFSEDPSFFGAVVYQLVTLFNGYNFVRTG